MSWADEIEQAMQNSESPFTVNDVLAKLRTGEARMWVSGELHGSVFIYDDNTAEVGHMAGKWTDRDGSWIIGKCRAYCKALGIDELHVHGRRGWQRFLRMKGFS